MNTLNAAVAMSQSIAKRKAAHDIINAACDAKRDGNMVGMVELLEMARAFIQHARDLYAYAICTGTLTHHYQFAARLLATFGKNDGAAKWRAVVRCDGELAWTSARRYAQRQSAQRVAGKQLGNMAKLARSVLSI